MANASKKRSIVKDNIKHATKLKHVAIAVNCVWLFLRLTIALWEEDFRVMSVVWGMTSYGAVSWVVVRAFFASVGRADDDGSPPPPRLWKTHEWNSRLEAMRDIMYLTWFIQLASLLHWSFWLLYILVPIYAGYQLCALKSKFSGMTGDGQEGPASKSQQKKQKRQERLEKQGRSYSGSR